MPYKNLIGGGKAHTGTPSKGGSGKGPPESHEHAEKERKADVASAKEAATKAIAKAIGVGGVNHKALGKALDAMYRAMMGDDDEK